MQKEIIVQLNNKFEDVVYQKNNVEYWMARDIQKLLDYEEWRNFLKAVDRAKQACLPSGQNVTDHFVGVNKMVSLGSGSERQVGTRARAAVGSRSCSSAFSAMYESGKG